MLPKSSLFGIYFIYLCFNFNSMGVIVDLTLPARSFELGRILPIESNARIELETLVPLGGRSIPYFRLLGESPSFVEHVNAHRLVQDIKPLIESPDETLFQFDWQVEEDVFFGKLVDLGVQPLDGTGTEDRWSFELYFPDHGDLPGIYQYCRDHDIPIDISRVYTPVRPALVPGYGLTTAQRDVLVRAIERGYFAIPRETSTQELADEFGISDQAIIERLRRGITRLVTNSLMSTGSAT